MRDGAVAVDCAERSDELFDAVEIGGVECDVGVLVRVFLYFAARQLRELLGDFLAHQQNLRLVTVGERVLRALAATVDAMKQRLQRLDLVIQRSLFGVELILQFADDVVLALQQKLGQRIERVGDPRLGVLVVLRERRRHFPDERHGVSNDRDLGLRLL